MTRFARHALDAFCLGAMLAVCGMRTVSAQAPPDLAHARALRDSLLAVHDIIALRALETRTLPLAKANHSDAALHLRLGLIALRLGDLTGDAGHFADAGQEFQWATEIHPEWPDAWFGLGLAELGLMEGEPPFVLAVQTRFGKDPAQKSVDDFVRSTMLDPGWSEGLATFGITAANQRLALRVPPAVAALRKLPRAMLAAHPDLALARVRAEFTAGNPDSALALLGPLMERDARNPATLFELARARFLLGRNDGVDPWYRGLAAADPVTLALYRCDLETIMPDTTLRAFDAAEGEARATLVRRFWDSRDHDDLHVSGERLREHYRRLDFARRNYSLPHHADVLQSPVMVPARYDDRGRVFVRLGAPDEHASLSMIGVPGNESWLYHQKGKEDFVVNFVVREPDPSYHMTESILDILALTKQSMLAHRWDKDRQAQEVKDRQVETYGAAWVAGIAQELLYSREKMPIYAKMISGGKTQASALQAKEREMGRVGIDLALHSDRWSLSYELPLPASLEVVAVGSDAAGTLVQLAFAIPGGTITPVRSSRGLLYTMRTRATFLAADGSVVAEVDTTRTFISQEWIPLDGHLLGRLPVHVPPGTWTVRVALETEGRGIVTPRQTVDVVSLTGPALHMSDIVLGSRSVKLGFPALRGDTAWINPLHTFSKKEPMGLYFELAGLVPGAKYHTELTVSRPPKTGIFGNSGSTEMRLAFDGVKSGEVDPIQRELSLERLDAGTYVLEITISTADGQRVVRRRTFTVIK